jgi:hypothetical protein
VQQLQKLRDLVATQINMQGNYMAQQGDRTSASEAAEQQFAARENTRGPLRGTENDYFEMAYSPLCASALAGSVVTVAVQGNSECTAVSEQQRHQRDADAAFERARTLAAASRGTSYGTSSVVVPCPASVLVAGNAMAANDLSHADTSVQGLLDLVQNASNQWAPRLHDYAFGSWDALPSSS